MFAAVLSLSLLLAGCSDSDRAQTTASDQAILQVIVGIADPNLKGTVPADTAGFNLMLFNANGEQISEKYGYKATGSEEYAQWQDLGSNKLLLELEVPEDIVTQVDRLEVDAYDSEENFTGVLTMGEVHCAMGSPTIADFTKPDAPEYVTVEEYNANSFYAFKTAPAAVDQLVTINIQGTVTVTASQVYQDAAGLEYAYPCPDKFITLTTEAKELEVDGNVITGTAAVSEAPVTAAFLNEASTTFKVTVTDSNS